MLKAALLLLGALTLSVLVWHIGIGRIYEAVTQLGPAAMLVILLPSLLMYILEAYGWLVTLGAWAKDVPFWRVLAIRTAGEVVNMTTPTAYVGGEPLKAFLLKRQGVPIVEGLASVVTAKTTMTIAQILFILAGIGLGFWLLGAGGSAGQTITAGLVTPFPNQTSTISREHSASAMSVCGNANRSSGCHSWARYPWHSAAILSTLRN